MANLMLPQNYQKSIINSYGVTDPNDPNAQQKQTPTQAPAPYQPPPTSTSATSQAKAMQAPQPPQTFSQMQAAGVARPPAPSANVTTQPASPPPTSTTPQALGTPANTPPQSVTATQLATGGVATAPSTGGVYSGLYQPQPGATISTTDPRTGQPVSGQAQAFTMPDGTVITGIPSSNGTFIDSFGQVINAQTGLTLNGAKPYGQAAGMAVPNGQGGVTPYYGGGNVTAGGTLASILGTPATGGPGGTPNTTTAATSTPSSTSGLSFNMAPPTGGSAATGGAPSTTTPTTGTSGLANQPSGVSPTGGYTTPTPSGLGGTSPTAGFDILNSLTGVAQGGAPNTSPLGAATTNAAMNQLNSPSPYSSTDVKNLYNWLSGNIQDQYALQKNQLAQDMAARGLGASTIYAGNLNDLNIGQRSAQESLAQDLAQNYAQTLGQYQANAINQGNQVSTQNQNNYQNLIAQLMGYGQNAFNNDVTTQELNQNAQTNWQNYILNLLNMGYSPTG